MARTPLIAGNWKMYKTQEQAEEYIQTLLPRVSAVDGVDIAICVPFTDLQPMVDSTRGSPVEVFAQNMHHDPEGPFTGEVSPPMLVELDVRGVVLGHSERRAMFGETDRALALKVPAALRAGLVPILCVGETEEERDKDETDRKLRQQINDDLSGVPDEQLAAVVIAYEPIWAIGTGRVATPEQAQEAIAFIRALVAGRDRAAAEAVRILYGGSVKPENAPELLELEDVDGALVGGASLDPQSFASIVAATAASPTRR
jgi:triosephosphate isomerase